MALVQQTIKNLIAGISQQPPKLRHAEQLEEQINGYSTEAGGLQKRPPTQHIKKLPTLPLKTKIHIINRDDNERYIIAFTGTGIRIFDLNGNEKTVNMANTSTQYVTCEKPNEQLKAITVADSMVENTQYVYKDKSIPMRHLMVGKHGTLLKLLQTISVMSSLSYLQAE